MDDALRLTALARDQVSQAERFLAAASTAAWTGPAAAAYGRALDERRDACAALAARLDTVVAQLAVALAAGPVT